MISIEAYRTTIGSYLTQDESLHQHISCQRNAKHFQYKYTNKSCAGIFQTTNSSLYFLRVFGCFVFISTFVCKYECVISKINELTY